MNAIIKPILRWLIGVLFFVGISCNSYGNVTDDGFLTQNKYALYRLLLLNQAGVVPIHFPVNWSQDCNQLEQYPYLRKNSGFFAECAPKSRIFSLNGVQLFQSYNSNQPSGLNDGAIWQGAGYTTAFSFSSTISWKSLSVSLQPVFGFNQNKAYDLHPYPYVDNQPYTYWLHRVDFVQRMGDSPVFWVDPGYSEIELSFGSFHTGISTAPILTGPGIQTSLLYSYNAAGIPRFFIGNQKPVNTPIGHFGAQYFYGFLKKSSYFDQSTNNRLTSVHNLNLQYTPSFYRNLTLGFNRTYQETYPESFKEVTQDVAKMFNIFSESAITRLSDVDWSPDNQLFTFYLHWLFPSQQFELYGEWGRDDHGVNLEELFIQPDHSRAYLFGFQKSYNLSTNKLLGIGFEMTHMDTPRNTLVRFTANNPFGMALFPWGTHTSQRVGMTNKGQLLGNGYGLGANILSVRLEYLNLDSFTRFTFNKIAHNPLLVDDPRYRSTVRLYNGYTATHATRMTELLVTMHHTRTILAGTELGVGLDLSYTLNRYHISNNNGFNARFEFSLRREIQPWW